MLKSRPPPVLFLPMAHACLSFARVYDWFLSRKVDKFSSLTSSASLCKIQYKIAKVLMFRDPPPPPVAHSFLFIHANMIRENRGPAGSAGGPGMDGMGPGRGGGRGGPSQRGGFFGGRGGGMGRGRGPPGPLPPNYLCRRCSQPGHHIMDCPTNGKGQEMDGVDAFCCTSTYVCCCCVMSCCGPAVVINGNFLFLHSSAPGMGISYCDSTSVI